MDQRPSTPAERIRRHFARLRKRAGAGTVARNSGILLVAAVLGQGAQLALLVFVGRLLGDEGLGQLTLALALTAITVRATSFGVSDILRREIAGKPDEASHYLEISLGIYSLRTLLNVSATLIAVFVIGYSGMTEVIIVIILASTVFRGLAEDYQKCFQAIERMEMQLWGTILLRALNAGLGLVAAIYLQSIIGVAVSYLIGETARMIYLYVRGVQIFGAVRPRWNWPVARAILLEGLPLGIAAGFAILSVHADSVILSIYASESEVGIYNAAYRLIAGAGLLCQAFLAAAFPRIASAYYSNTKRLSYLHGRTMAVAAAMGLAIALGGTLLGPWVIRLLYGADFAPAGLDLQILCWAVPMWFIAQASGITCTAIHKQVVNMWAGGITAAINIGLNLWLIPALSHTGAAWAKIGTYTVSALLLSIPAGIYVRRLAAQDEQVQDAVGEALRGAPGEKDDDDATEGPDVADQ